MGFIAPAPPPIPLEEWKAKPHLERIKPLAQDWSANGFGSPVAVYLLYVVKLIVYTLGAALLISATTPGLGGLGDLGSWWTEPIVLQKAVLWTMLWELLGLGSGSMPLTFRFIPPIGGVLYWLRPGTIRLPPWPDRVPLTRGTRRTIVDVALYGAVLGAAVHLLLSDGVSAEGFAAGRLDTTAIAVLLGLLVALGLRDKVSFLSSRPEIYGLMMVVSLFPFNNFLSAAQLVMVGIWLGAATSKLSHHFPYVVAVMSSNCPWMPKWAKMRLFRDHPDNLDLTSSAFYGAHLGTVIEFGLPLVLLFTHGGTVGLIAVAGMVVFHIFITSTFPLAVPLEWNLFMILGTLVLFGHYGDVPLSDLDNPLLIAILAVSLIGFPIAGNIRPDKISFLPSMRYYAGNWATTQWLFRKDTGAEEKFDRTLTKSARVVIEQLTRLYGRDFGEFLLSKALAFRSMHLHGRSLNGLLLHASDGDLEAFHVREGEFLSGATIGWNFGDGHFHGKQLLDAVQEQCQFAPGEVRVITLESQPIHIQRQDYKIYDAATGLIEEGFVRVADMQGRQPWLDEAGHFPAHVVWSDDQRARERPATAPIG